MQRKLPLIRAKDRTQCAKEHMERAVYANPPRLPVVRYGDKNETSRRGGDGASDRPNRRAADLATENAV